MTSKERKKATARIWNAKNKCKVAAYDRRCRLKARYGITPMYFETVKALQNMKCAICYESFAERIEIDHSHVTGKFRGLLCRKCNLGLGQFRDSVKALHSAANYLETR